jgi:aspartyl/asparaginyl beta-hydroxylase (cupin superfamily)
MSVSTRSSGWKLNYLKWYGDSHPSAMKLCPRTTELVQSIGSIKAAMFAELPPARNWCVTATRMPVLSLSLGP